MRVLILLVVLVAFVVLFTAMYMMVSDWFADRAAAKKDKSRNFYLSKIDQDLDSDIDQLYKNKIRTLREFDKKFNQEEKE